MFFFLIFNLWAVDSLTDLVLTGKYSPSKIPLTYSLVPATYATQNDLYMQKDALEAFIQLAENAKRAGFNIFIISAIRDFNSQKYIWESKFNGQRLVEGLNLQKAFPNQKKRALKILEYSSMPGTSRHHWGTDIDIGFDLKNINRMLTNEIYESGNGKEFYNWMQKNAPEYGFCQPYTDSPKNRNAKLNHGYQEEKWHWSYKPIASKYLKTFIENAPRYVPSGFEGSSISKDLYLDYVKNVNKDCY